MTSLAVASGIASARFFGTSSPRIIDSSVATAIATTDAIGNDSRLRQTESGQRTAAAVSSIAGSIV